MTTDPASANMRFRSGGITLTSLCVILLQLAEEGVVKLDDPIAQWCWALPTARAVTLRMLTESTFWNPSWTRSIRAPRLDHG
jgi:CubicO group peptidase (beta-lactamase class C family)